MTTSEIKETPEQIADRMNKVFVIRCFELLILRMLPNCSLSVITPVAEVAEQAMTEVADLRSHSELKDKLYNLCPLSEENAKTLHSTVCCFASNIMGVLMQKGQEIVNGTYTAEIFFNQSTST